MPTSSIARRIATCVAATVAAVPTMASATGTEPPVHPGPSVSYRMELMTGPGRPEDIVALPGTSHAVVSGMSSDPLSNNEAGALSAIDTRTREITELWPGQPHNVEWDKATYARCPGPPDPSAASPHGVNIEHRLGAASTLYVVNHGNHERIEVFELAGGAELALAWVGCVVMPERTFPNGVAPLPHGDGIVVTNFFDPTKPDPFEGMFSGQPTGDVRTWTPQTGWHGVPDSALGGPNGVEVTPDGQTAIVSAWGERRIYRLPLSSPEQGAQVVRTATPVDVMPDNLRWTGDGRLLMTGQDITEDEFRACQANDMSRCPTGLSVYGMRPQTMQVRTVYESDTDEFRVPTVAAPVGEEIWVGSAKGDAIARLIQQNRPGNPT